jgi:hypothetical protein
VSIEGELMIQHTVAFRLHESADQGEFLARAARLGALPGVRRFQVLRQVGSKNSFTHALSMFFETQGDYDGYNDHPDHVTFVAEVWASDVADFIELDYIELDTELDGGPMAEKDRGVGGATR